MPEQHPEQLINECPDLDLGNLKLYAIVQGERPLKPRWNNQYPFRQPPRPSIEAVGPVLWRGYIARYRLKADGRLWLEGYDYPLDPKQVSDEANECLEGTFWLLMKGAFYGECTYVPFERGVIVKDRDRWVRTECDIQDTRRGPAAARRRRPVLKTW